MRIFNIILLTIFSLSLTAQNVDEELGFVYVKAEYLLETNRYDEAIKEFNKIIAKDPAFKDALYKRAEAKFHVGAFQGTYNDVLQNFEVKGITPEGILLFGKAQKNLGKAEQAEVTLATAGELYPNGTSARDKSNRNKETNKNDTKKDRDPIEAVKEEISNILKDILPDDHETEESDSNTKSDDSSDRDKGRGGSDRTNERDTNSSSDRTDDSASGGQPNTSIDLGGESDSEPEYDEPEIDDSVKEIYIDEDVTLEIMNGLGARKVLQVPSILILSETSGSVVIDICVNENGKVKQAEYNASESSLNTQSIISLAVRKAKEFWFKSSSQDEMCGTIVFNIKGN